MQSAGGETHHSQNAPHSHPDARNEKPADETDEYRSSRGSRFRLKTKRPSKRKHDDENDSKHHAQSSGDRHRRHRSRKKHKSSRDEEENIEPPLSPNAAFRESLFDALADDEGAAYWEGIYGQPIHTYPRPGDQADGRGELEMMTDEEYATYVRARMWEKTHQAVLEERERRRRTREAEKEEKRKREEHRRTETDREAFERMIDESLRRGKDRKEKKMKVNKWVDVWARYLDSWKELDAQAREAAAATAPASGTSTRKSSSTSPLRNLIVWPVESGKRRNITPQAVEEFMRNAPPLSQSGTGTPASGQEAGATKLQKSDILAALKIERVRWHPDKIKHRYGILGMEDNLNKGVTEVFQILDRMWVEEHAKVKTV